MTKTKIVRDRHNIWVTVETPPVSLVREPGRFVYYAPGEECDGLTYCFDNEEDIEIEGESE